MVVVAPELSKSGSHVDERIHEISLTITVKQRYNHSFVQTFKFSKRLDVTSSSQNLSRHRLIKAYKGELEK